MKVIMVRHTAVDVPRGVCYGRSDVGLASTFLAEVSEVAEKLKGIFPDYVYTSPLSRCTRLAAACGYGYATADDRLMELDFGEWEMQRFDDITDPRLALWYDDWYNVAPTGGESFAGQGERVMDFMSMLSGLNAGIVLVFTHGGVIIHAMIAAGMVTPNEAFNHIPTYGGVMTIEWPST